MGSKLVKVISDYTRGYEKKIVNENSDRIRVMQANLNNQGGAFSVAYEAQKKLQDKFVFDYFSAEIFLENDVYNHLLEMGSKCIGGVECTSRVFKQYAVYKKFRIFLAKNNYQYVHIHADTAWKILIYYVAAKMVGVPKIVVHSHSSGINGHYKKINYMLHCLAKLIIKKATCKCACSDVAANWMFDTRENVYIIQNGVDLNRYCFNEISREKVRKELNLQDIIVIGTVGDYSYQKNPEFLYDIMLKYKDRPNYVFLMVGNREQCLLKDYVEKNKLVENVIFTGMVTNIPDYLNAMDIFILPSRFEGLPMCALEAQATGLYTIVSDKITEQTKCSEHFDRIELDLDKWIETINSIDLNYQRGNKEYLDVEKLSSDNTAKCFRRIYIGETI